MISAYPACFIKETNGYSIIFPDLNYLATCGDNLEDAFAMAVDCLAGYLYTLQRDNENPPVPSSLSQINLNLILAELGLTYVNADDVFVNLVTVDVAEYARTHFEKSVKKTLTIPAWLNKAALEQNLNFSQVLQEALLQKINAKSNIP